MPQNYTPAGSALTVVIPELSDLANAETAFKQYTDSLAAAGGSVPVGTIVQFVGDNDKCPDGWLVCIGQEVSAAKYPMLAALCSGERFGSASVGNFKLPDLRQRLPLGASGTTMPIGSKGGSSTTILQISNLPSHTHTTNSAYADSSDATHSHSFSGTTTSDPSDASHSHDFAATGASGSSSAAHSHSGTTASDGTHSHDSRTSTATNHDRTGNDPSSVWRGTNTGNRTSNNGVHSHSFTTSSSEAAHTHAVSLSGTTGSSGGAHTHAVTVNGNTGTDGGSHTHDVTVSLNPTGDGLPVDNMPPYLALNFLIKAG